MTKPDNIDLILQLILDICILETLKSLSVDLGKNLESRWTPFFLGSLSDFLAFFEVRIKPSCDYTFTAGPDLICSSYWALNSDDFPFFRSSIAHLEPGLQRFEVWSIFVS